MANDFTHVYPYQDLHELNLDWILEEMKSLKLDINAIEQRATEKATANAIEYVTAELNVFNQRMIALADSVERLKGDMSETVQTLQEQYNTFVREVNDQITIINAKVLALNDKIDASVISVNARTDVAIRQNNEYILEQITEHIGNVVTVVNYFTGETVSIQDMVDYLASLHATDGVTITELVNANKTVNQIIAYDQNVTSWIMRGRTIIS